MPEESTLRILTQVLDERMRQDQKWGQQNHSPEGWMIILVEEIGEASKSICDFYFKKKPYEDIRKELVQSAAVCVAFIESLDRNRMAILDEQRRRSGFRV